MLTDLRVRDLALIRTIDIRLRSGLTVITGETGAGKSMLVGALQLALGGRARADQVRPGAREAIVEAVFEPPATVSPTLGEALATRGIRLERPLTLTRRVASSGRGQARVNGCALPLTLLRELATGCVEISSQHAHTALRDPQNQRRLLDGFGGTLALASQLSQQRSELRRIAAQLDTARAARADRVRRRQTVHEALAELDQVADDLDAVDALAAEARRLAHGEQIASAVGGALGALRDGEEPMLDALAFWTRKLQATADLADELAQSAELLEAARIHLSEAVRSLSVGSDGWTADPARQAAVERRLAEIDRVCRKHGTSPEGLAGQRAALQAERQSLEDAVNEEQALDASRETLAAAVATGAERLSRRRRSAARRLERAVGRTLAGLGMADHRLSIALERVAEESAEAVRFGIACTPGAPPLPLARTASGGELSRLLLALRSAVLDADPVGCVVLDEIDTGISGAVAEAMGRQIKRVAESRQVICVTHLPQIAALADHHMVAERTRTGRHPISRLRLLEAPQRVQEVARMLAGREITPTALAHARMLIETAAVPHEPRAVSARHGARTDGRPETSDAA